MVRIMFLRDDRFKVVYKFYYYIYYYFFFILLGWMFMSRRLVFSCEWGKFSWCFIGMVSICVFYFFFYLVV